MLHTLAFLRQELQDWRPLLLSSPTLPWPWALSLHPPLVLYHFITYTLHCTHLYPSVTFSALYLLQCLKLHFSDFERCVATIFPQEGHGEGAKGGWREGQGGQRERSQGGWGRRAREGRERVPRKGGERGLREGRERVIREGRERFPREGGRGGQGRVERGGQGRVGEEG
jgi:hypothetical protein